MSQPYSPDAPPTSRIRLLLFAVWLVLTLGGVVFVLVLGSNAPYADEWEFVPALVGEEPLGPWLWMQHNEHRLPLPRLLYFTLFQVTHDFRTGMLLQVLLLSAMSLGLMQLTARLRGKPQWADAFFPVSLLHLGHWENFIMGYQICFTLFAVFVTGLVVVALRTTRENAFRSGACAAVLVFLTALTGSSGLALVPPVAAWMAYLAVLLWNAGAKGKSLTLLALALMLLAYIGLYFSGYARPTGHPPLSYDPQAIGEVTGVVLSLGVGVSVSQVWPVIAAGEVLLGLATVVFLVRRPREEWPASAGLIAVAAGVFGLALTLGLARAEWGAEVVGQWSRYSLLTWPLLGAAYLVWAKAGRKWLPMGLCALAALAFPANMLTGLQNGTAIRASIMSLEVDARAGMPASYVVRRHLTGSGQEERALRGIPLLRAAGIGAFAGKPDANP